MTTTNQTPHAKTRGNGKARVLPIDAERQRLQESADRAKRLAQEAEAAQRELAEAEARMREMESHNPNESSDTKTVDAAVTGFTHDITQFFADMTKKYGFHINYEQPRLVKRGFISGKFKADLMPTLVPLGEREDGVIAREAGRFIKFYKQLELQPDLMGKEISLTGEESKYIVVGLRGKGHSVVLQKAGTKETFMMDLDAFKRSTAA